MTIQQQSITIKVGKRTITNASMFYMSKDIMDTQGIARFEIPFSEDYNKLFAPGTKDIEVKGGSPSGRIFFGTSTGVTRKGDTLSVTMSDYGANFKKTYSGTYTDEELQVVVKKLIKEVEFEPVLENISPEILTKKISQTTTLETAATGGVTASGGATICGDFKKSKGKSDGKWYHSCFPNYCPNCGKSGTLEYGRAIGAHDIITVCGRKEYSGGSAADAKKGIWGIVEGHLFCCMNKGGCDADYCGVTGLDHGGKKSITPISQSVIAAPSTTTSGGNLASSAIGAATSLVGSLLGGAQAAVGAMTAGTPVATAQTTSTYEDTLNQILKDNNLYMYLDHYKKCHISEFKGPGKVKAEITPVMIDRDFYSYLNGEDKDKAIEVRVKYKNGEISKFFGDKSKVKEENVQKYDKPDLDQSKAEEFANTALLQTLREQNLELGIRSLGGSNLYPGVWVRVPTIALFSKKEVMYICGLATVIRPREPISFDLILKYSPPVPEIKTASGAMAGPVDLASIDAIGAKAATFKYSHGCSASACIESGGSGDCYAMSDWLYEKLTAIGVKSQIQWCSGPRNHRTVQIDVGSGWQDFDYGKYNIETMFKVSSSRSGCRVYR